MTNSGKDKKRRGGEVNWELVKAAYCAGAKWDDLEAEFRVAHGALAKHVKDGNWEEEKKKFQAKVAEKVTEIQEKKAVKSMVEFNEIVGDSADRAANIAAKVIEFLEKNMDNEGGKFPKSEELKDLLKVQETALSIKRLVNNIPPPSSSQERSEEFDEYSRELARLHFARINGEPVDSKKPTIIKIEKPQSLEKVN